MLSSCWLVRVLGLPSQTWVISLRSMNIWNSSWPRSRMHWRVKTRIAQYYDQTVLMLLKRIVAGPVVHIDETKARIRGATGYVWVFTNVCEVVYVYSESREADILVKVMDGFDGVLVSDFYSAYD